MRCVDHKYIHIAKVVKEFAFLSVMSQLMILRVKKQIKEETMFFFQRQLGGVGRARCKVKYVGI